MYYEVHNITYEVIMPKTLTWINEESSLVAQMVRRLPTMWETQVRSLGRADPLEKEMKTHSSALAWKIPWREEPGSLWGPWGRKELDMTEWLNFQTLSTTIQYIGTFKGQSNKLNGMWNDLINPRRQSP